MLSYDHFWAACESETASAECGRGPPKEKGMGGPSTRQDAYQDGPKKGKSRSSEVGLIGPCGDLRGGVYAVGRHRFGMGTSCQRKSPRRNNCPW